MIKLNQAELRDKIYACWLGKNIGGTMGTPYEGKQQINDIKGFASAPGEPLPNDDLDLQLIWLKAVQEHGPKAITSQLLGEYWIDYITPFWNEYGIGKSNMMAGLVPPISGQYQNGWKDSNGAWIRTEIWACLHPAMVEKAIALSFEDASVDHGFAEGSYAAIFVAAMESAAFVCDDLRTLIDIGLSKIPADCRVARSIHIVLDAYEKGLDWKTARQLVTDDSMNGLGWFMAPANVAYTVLGLLYGGCDFKKSLIIAINCGDDTDCTGATAGALLGIMYGTKCIPADWQEYIGDRIITVAVSRGSTYVPPTCTVLTDEVMELLPVTLYRSGICVTEEATDLSDLSLDSFKGTAFCDRMFNRSPYSFETDFVFAKAIVEYDDAPDMVPGGQLGFKLTVKNTYPAQKHVKLRFITPEGWRVEGRQNVAVQTTNEVGVTKDFTTEHYTIYAGEQVLPTNRIILEITCDGRPTTGLVPMVILG